MQSERETFFIGTCVQSTDAAAFVDVRVQRHGAKLRDVSGSSHALFPPHGEVELNGVSGAPLWPGDWVAFHIAAQAPQERGKLRVAEYRRLLPFEDLFHVGSSEAVRRLLVEDGRSDGVPGETMLRIGEREMVRVQIAQNPDGRWRAVSGIETARLAVWLFDPKLFLCIPNGPESVTLVDPNESLQQIGTIDWSCDADLVRKIIRSLARVGETEDEALRQFAAALARFADSLQRDASPPETIDIRTAQEVLRVRNLGSMLKERQDLLRDYFEALRDDPEVKSLLELQISAVARQTVEAERPMLVEKLIAELEQDFALRRAQREAELNKSLEALSTEMTGQLERRIAVASAELEAALADREMRGREALEATLGKQRAELDAAVSSLEDRRAALRNDIELLEQSERGLSASIEDLSTQEASALEGLERLRVRREADIKKSVEDLSTGMIGELERRMAVRSAEFEADLADRDKHAREALEASLGKQRAELASAVSSLEDRRTALAKEIEELEQRQHGLSASIADLASREARALESLELRRAQREADIKKWIEDLSTGMIGDLERRMAVRSAEFEADLADRQKQAREALEASLGKQRAELDSAVSSLEDRRAAAAKEIELLGQRERELSASIATLSDQAASERESLELYRAQREADIQKSVADLSTGTLGDLEQRIAARSAEFEADLADRERQGREALETTLGKQRVELDSAVSSLEDRRAALAKEIELQEQRERELAASIEDLASREARTVESVARLSRLLLEDAPNPGFGSANPSGR